MEFKIKEWLKYFEEAEEVTNISLEVEDDEQSVCTFKCTFPSFGGLALELQHNAMREVDMDNNTTVYGKAVMPFDEFAKESSKKGKQRVAEYDAYVKENTVKGDDDFVLAVFSVFASKALKASKNSQKLPAEDKKKLVNALTYFVSHFW